MDDWYEHKLDSVIDLVIFFVGVLLGYLMR